MIDMEWTVGKIIVEMIAFPMIAGYFFAAWCFLSGSYRHQHNPIEQEEDDVLMFMDLMDLNHDEAQELVDGMNYEVGDLKGPPGHLAYERVMKRANDRRDKRLAQENNT